MNTKKQLIKSGNLSIRQFMILIMIMLSNGLIVTLNAQAPQAIPYQAVARNNAGSILATQAISLRLSIHDATAAGTVVYKETHAVTTNNLGLFNVNIGQGIPVTGTLSAVNWGINSKFIQVELDPLGGTNYTDMGTTQLMSVPYALSSGDNLWIKNGSNISNINAGSVGIGTNNPIATLDVRGTSTFIGNNSILSKFDFGPATNQTLLGSELYGITGGPQQRFSSSLNSTYTDIGLDSSGNFVIEQNDDTKLVVKSNGNVGIGTSTPSSKLTVNSYGYGMVQTDNTVSVGTYLDSDGGWFGTNSNHSLHFYTNDSPPKVTLTTNGNVGIGTTSPSTKLEVSDGTDSTSYIRFYGNSTGDIAAPALAPHINGGNFSIFAGVPGSGTLRFRVLNNGNVGIGTSTPFAKLNISSTNDPEITNNPPTGGFAISSSSDIHLIMGASASGMGWIQNRSSYLSGPVFYPLSLQPLGGNVGIGIDNPIYKLHVVGRSYITDGLLSPKIAVNSNLDDVVNGSPWYGIGYSSLTLPNQSQPATQVAGYWGLNFVDRGGNMVFSNGKLGIGTQAPATPLHLVSGTTNGHISFNGAQVDCKIGTDGVNDMWLDNSTLTALSAKSISFKMAGNAKMTIRGNGNVGIGTTNPLVPLHINTIANVSPGAGYLFGASGLGGSYNGVAGASILASGTIIASNFYAVSDERIKNVIGISNSSNDLKLLNKIKVTDYTYVDKLIHGTNTTKKVIAQQVEDVLPNAVSKSINFIPNLYALATKTELVNNKLQITLAKEHSLKAGDKLKWIDEKEQEQQSMITKIIDPNTIEIDYAQKSDKAFVYGIEVNDFRTVDYEAIAMLNVSATQELLKRIELLEKENDQLKNANIQSNELNQLNSTRISTINAKLDLLLQTSVTVSAQK